MCFLNSNHSKIQSQNNLCWCYLCHQYISCPFHHVIMRYITVWLNKSRISWSRVVCEPLAGRHEKLYFKWILLCHSDQVAYLFWHSSVKIKLKKKKREKKLIIRQSAQCLANSKVQCMLTIVITLILLRNGFHYLLSH